MSKFTNVWVFCDSATRFPDVIAGALQFGEKASVFVLGGQDEVGKAFAAGASQVYALGGKVEGRVVEDYAKTIAETIKSQDTPTLVLLPATRRSKVVAAKLSFLLGAGAVNEASEVNVDGGTVKVKHMVYGGLAHGEESITSPIAIVTVASSLFAPLANIGASTGDVVNVAFVAPANQGIKCLELRAKQGVEVDLAKATRVVGVGRGIAAQEDIAIVEELCQTLGAELGCTRPIAEGEKWMGRERYIGVSGVMLKPEVYIALGISGQIQHMVGVNGAQAIVAVNKEKNAPIFQFADYGLVGDIYKVMPALIAAFKK